MRVHSALVISQTDTRPMYLQIIEQIRHKVAIGDWPPGAELPSIRQLAADLSVSVITVKRAYLELEHGGVILTQHGRGSIVAPRQASPTAMWEEQLEQTLDEAARLGRLLGLDAQALTARLQATLDKTKED